MVDKLLKGFSQFRKDAYEGQNPLMPRLVEEGQSPEYFIISCIDSRSNPGTIFRPKPGTFMAHKAMGAIVRPYKKGTALSAALQFSITFNNVRKIILLGHTGCSAIKALIDKIEDPEIASFIEVAQEGLQKARVCCGEHCQPNELLRHAEEQILLQSLANLKTYPSVATALKERRLTIVSLMFDMESGNLMAYNAVTNKFEPITDYALIPSSDTEESKRTFNA